MPAVTVNDITVLPRVNEVTGARARKVKSITTAPQGFEGEGFPVRRAFAGVDMAELDPFIHLDQMGEVEYAPGEPKGTPWHPHRGFETVTYIIDGIFDHQDNNGGGGRISDGDTQWMTAGAGILHIETPPESLVMSGGLFHGFQLWVNLPARDKMCDPRYQEFPPESIPVVRPVDGIEVKLIAGDLLGQRGPVQGIATAPVYWDIALAANTRYAVDAPASHQAFLYVFQGDVVVGPNGEHRVPTGQMAVLGSGNTIDLLAGPQGGRLLLIAGQPLREPVARYGPFVMNTPAEIQQAFVDYREGRF